MLHYTNDGQVSWCGFARAVFEEAGADPARVLPITSEAFPRPAPRPAYSVLSTETLTARFGLVPRPWQDALADCLERLVPRAAVPDPDPTLAPGGAS